MSIQFSEISGKANLEKLGLTLGIVFKNESLQFIIGSFARFLDRYNYNFYRLSL
jgi:hypothetical protein